MHESNGEAHLRLSSIFSVALKLEGLQNLCGIVITLFIKQNTLLRISKDYLPVLNMFWLIRELRCILQTYGHPASNFPLADYVGHAVQGVEAILLLLCFIIGYTIRFIFCEGIKKVKIQRVFADFITKNVPHALLKKDKENFFGTLTVFNV